jgi:hypothetical protein
MGIAGPCRGDGRAEVARRHGDGLATCDARDRGIDDRDTFGVVERELLGVVRQDADRVDAGRHEVVDNPSLTVEVERLVVVEHGWRDRHHAPQQGTASHFACHRPLCHVFRLGGVT